MRLLSTFLVVCLAIFSLQAQDYPLRTIEELRMNDSEGSPMLLDSTCEIRAIVHSPSFRTSGTQFVVIDAENVGVTVFSSDYEDYDAQVGDELAIFGTVDFFNGLTELIPDNIIVLSEGNDLQMATEVSMLSEATESQLVIAKGVSLVNESQWTGQGSGFNVDVTDGTTTFQLRIDNNTDLYSLSAPQGIFDVTGVGGQFDNSAPYDGGYQLFPRSTMDLSVEVDEVVISYPSYSIGQMTTNDADGSPDSLGVTCALQGVVYGINLRAGNDLQFTIIDENNDGIGLFSPIDFGYTVAEGDEIIVKGEITAFNGVTQIFPDSLQFVSAGNALVAPTEVIELGEETESQLIQINCLQLVDTMIWTPSNSTIPLTFVEPGTGQEYEVQIDEQTDILDAAMPTGLVNITGIGWQSDNTAPYDDFYKIAPRYMADIVACENVSNTDELLAASSIRLYPNPVSDLLQLESKEAIERVLIYDLSGKKLLDISATRRVNTGNLVAGIYTIQVQTKRGIWMDKFIKE